MNKEKVLNILYKIFIKYQLLVVLLIILDQITKLLAVNFLNNPINIFGLEWFRLELQINSGVAFSFLADAPQWISALVSVVAVVALEIYINVKKPKSKYLTIVLLFLIAGSLGNGIDRWLSVFGKYTGYSGVIDFIFPTFFANFNVADIYVTMSCVFLLVYFIFSKDDSEPSRKEMKIAKAKLDALEVENSNDSVKIDENTSTDSNVNIGEEDESK